VLNLIPWLELKVAWYREALDAPILSRLSRDMRKMLLRIAIVLGLLVSTARAKVMIQVDLDMQQMTVTKNNGETHVWKVSSGRSGFETPTGLFNVQRLDANHFSDEYDQSPMPYSIFFYEGLAIHGTYQGGLGRPVSHGCVRLAVPHARMLYSWVKLYGASIEINGMASETLDTDDSLSQTVDRAGSVCLSSFSGLISGMPAGFRPPRSAAAG
jgi:L,D-transpeptidase catalytic domain